MPDRLPLLLFPKPVDSVREDLSPGWPSLHLPSGPRQVERLGQRFEQLEAASDARRMQLSTGGLEADPDFVVVLETVGSIDKFLTAVSRTPGVEWLFETDELDFEPDEDFHHLDKYGNPIEAVLPGRLFLLGTNRAALAEVIKIWNLFREDQDVVLPHGLRKWKAIFNHLKDVRFWGVNDRLAEDVQQYWKERIDFGEANVVFEIEAWCSSSTAKNEKADTEVRALVAKAGGVVLRAALIPEIAYHGFLVRMPKDAVEMLLTESPPEIALSEHVMFFRPRGQSLAQPSAEGEAQTPIPVPQGQIAGTPVAALFDGLPLQNHPVLAGRLLVDDPDNFEAGYGALERAHGTAMASLITVGELDGDRIGISRPLYVRPILKPDPADFNAVRAESTPNDQLLIDLIHRAVRRLFEAEAIAPTVKLINLSVGDIKKPFDKALSPWSRLLDWLSSKYQVLFIVSAGNDGSNLELDTSGTALQSMTADGRQEALLKAMFSMTRKRSYLAPAESLNALTIGAAHADESTFPEVAGRWNLLVEPSLACYSRGGRGFRRAIKPDILMPGGRALRIEPPVQANGALALRLVDSTLPPGHRVACAPDGQGNDTRYTRGTSNAAAMATRAGLQLHQVIDTLRAGAPSLSAGRFDAVLLKALLVHGAEWGNLKDKLQGAIPVADARHIPLAVAGAIGYGLGNIERSMGCTDQRATLLGVGELIDGQGMEFEAPLPPCLVAQRVKRRLTLTLAWLSPVRARHAKYRTARLWVNPPHENLRATRVNAEWRDVKRGTVQHEIFEGEEAFAFADGDTLRFKVNCAAEAGKIEEPVLFAICVSLEVAEGVEYPIYQEISQRVQARTQVPVGD